MKRTHKLLLNKWYVNKDRTCFVKPLEELGSDNKALCIFVDTGKLHIQIYRARREAVLLKACYYVLVESTFVTDESIDRFVMELSAQLITKYEPGEKGSFPLTDSEKSPTDKAFKSIGLKLFK